MHEGKGEALAEQRYLGEECEELDDVARDQPNGERERPVSPLKRVFERKQELVTVKHARMMSETAAMDYAVEQLEEAVGEETGVLE